MHVHIHVSNTAQHLPYLTQTCSLHMLILSLSFSLMGNEADFVGSSGVKVLLTHLVRVPAGPFVLEKLLQHLKSPSHSAGSCTPPCSIVSLWTSEWQLLYCGLFIVCCLVTLSCHCLLSKSLQHCRGDCDHVQG